MNALTSPRISRKSGLLVVSGLALMHFLLHVLTNGNYGMFRDEFYYIACSDHLAWGYVDHPPLSIALLAGSRVVLGESVQAIRLLPALMGSLLVILTGLMTRELGGGRFAQIFAALCVMIVPIYLVVTGFFSMNAFDCVFWVLSFSIIIRIITTDNEKLWLLFGLAVGLGLLNKISILVFGCSVVAGLLFTPYRRYFRSKYFWMAGGIALLVFVPHILWQVANDWPTVEFISNAKRYKIAPLTPLQFLGGQIMGIHPLNAPIWLAGLLFLLFAKKGQPYRILGLTYAIAFAVLAIQRSKAYYLSPAYPALLAAGGWAIEALLHRRGWHWAKPILLGIVLIGGAATAPLVVPILPVETFIGYQKFLGVEPSAEETNPLGELPQYFADRFGWENMTATVASVYEGLSPEQQAECVIVTGNYGEAGAIDYFGPRYGLPPAISQHNSYYLWGPGDVSGNVMISVGISREDLENAFESVTEMATIVSPYAMPYENHMPVYLCVGLRVPLNEAWQRGKHYM